MLLAGDPLEVGQQSGVLVAGPGRVARIPGPFGEVSAVNQGIGVIHAICSWSRIHQRAKLIPRPAASPGSPVHRANWPRALGKSEWSDPSTSSQMASSTANRSRAQPHPPPRRTNRRSWRGWPGFLGVPLDGPDLRFSHALPYSAGDHVTAANFLDSLRFTP
jgi:hypothetical protein